MTLDFTDRDAPLLKDALECYAYECQHSSAMLELMHEPGKPVVAITNLQAKRHRALQLAALIHTNSQMCD